MHTSSLTTLTRAALEPNPFPCTHGLVCRYMVRAADAAVYDPTAMQAEPLILCEGKPSCNNILQAIALTCLYAPQGNNGRPYKPGSLKISYRCRGQVPHAHKEFRRARQSSNCVQHRAWLWGWVQQQGRVLHLQVVQYSPA